MVTGGVKKTRTEGNRAHKNTDKIGFTVLTFSQRPPVCLCARSADASVCVNHVNLCKCLGACVSACVQPGGCTCMLMLTRLLRAECEARVQKGAEDWDEDSEGR